MENTTKSICCICHDVIETQHVFSENNQVFLKRNMLQASNGSIPKDQWYPINFQWVSDMELRNNLVLQSNLE